MYVSTTLGFIRGSYQNCLAKSSYIVSHCFWLCKWDYQILKSKCQYETSLTTCCQPPFKPTIFPITFVGILILGVWPSTTHFFTSFWNRPTFSKFSPFFCYCIFTIHTSEACHWHWFPIKHICCCNKVNKTHTWWTWLFWHLFHMFLNIKHIMCTNVIIKAKKNRSMVKNKSLTNLDCTQSSCFFDNLQMFNPLNCFIRKEILLITYIGIYIKKKLKHASYLNFSTMGFVDQLWGSPLLKTIIMSHFAQSVYTHALYRLQGSSCLKAKRKNCLENMQTCHTYFFR